MTITRINQFEAKSGAEEKLHAFLQSVIAVIMACPGCLSCRLLRSTEKSACLAIIEEWHPLARQRQRCACDSTASQFTSFERSA